jgi:outer membrane protein assembly factor BamB
MQRVLYLFTVVSLVGILGCVENQAQTSQNPAKADKGSTTTVGSGADQQSDDSATTVAVADSEKPKSPAADQADDLPPPKLDLRITGETPVAEAQKIANEKGRADDWNQWGGSSLRNNAITVAAPTEWEVGEFNDETGEWKKETAENIKWAAALGSQTYGNVVVAGGKAFIGTNNGAGYLKRYPADVDLGVLVCFDSKDGAFLWQDSSEKLHTGRVHDWPLLGVCSSPSVEGDRVYYVTNRGELKCLDAEGFADGENDGPITNEKELAQKNTPMGEWEEKREADVVWVLDMMDELGVSQHNMANSAVAIAGDWLFLMTSNGVDDAHERLPSPLAASFIAVDKRNGKVLWSDNTPGYNVLHGQWSSPACATIDGVPQVIFGGGDGWLYGFDARGENGKSKLLWKFDCNPKESVYKLTGATRNHIIGTPVIHDNKVFIGVGEDPEHGEGVGHLWCVDPTKRGDVSPDLVFNSKDLSKPIEHKRNQAMVEKDGDLKRPNPDSAAVWHYSTVDANGDGKLIFEETMHRTMGTVAIKDDILVVADFSGLVHCLDAKTGKPYWTHDMLAACWSSPLIAGEHIYISDEDGEVTIMKLSKEKEEVAAINMGNSVYSTPIVANGVLYISNKSYLFAIGGEKTAE